MRRRYSAAGGFLDHLNENKFYRDIPKQRKCLKCEMEFTSHQGRRVCPVCSAQNKDSFTWEVAKDARASYR